MAKRTKGLYLCRLLELIGHLVRKNGLSDDKINSAAADLVRQLMRRKESAYK